MATDPEATQVRVAVYTPHVALVGSIEITYGRLTDQLNLATTRFIHLRDVRYVPLGAAVAGQATPTFLEEAFISAREVVLVHPLEKDTDRPSGRSGFRVERRPVPVQILFGPLWATGTLHIPRLGILENFLEGVDQLFLPLTGLTIRHLFQEGFGVIRAPFGAVNRDFLLIGVERAALEPPKEEEEEEETAPIQEGDVPTSEEADQGG